MDVKFYSPILINMGKQTVGIISSQIQTIWSKCDWPQCLDNVSDYFVFGQIFTDFAFNQMVSVSFLKYNRQNF